MLAVLYDGERTRNGGANLFLYISLLMGTCLGNYPRLM